jgi:predicted Zn-dependent peptidase
MITSRVLDSGLTLLCEVIPGVRSCGLTWLVPAGSATDPDDRQGLSTMLAELLFRGAGSLDSRQHADALDGLGVSSGCDVGPVFLRLSATMIGAKLDDALPLIVEMVRRPRLDADAIEPTRDLALQALAGLPDNPQERASILLGARHNAPPFNRSGLGTAEGLASITRDELVRRWHERARPGSCIVGIAGDVDPDRVASRLNALLAGWSGAATPVVPGVSATRGMMHHEPDDGAQVQILLAHDAPPEPHPDSRFERLVNAVLSGGSASRLFSEVREKRALCYSVSAGYAPDKLFGRVIAYVGTTPERAQESLDVLCAELVRIASSRPEDRVSPEEFQRAIIGAKTRLVFSGESSSARAAALAVDQWRLGRARSLGEMRAEVEAITLDQLHQYLARRTLGQVTIVTLGASALKRPAGI